MFKRIEFQASREEPPACWSAPRIELDDIDWTDWADDPYPLYRRLRDEAPVYWDERNQTFVLTRTTTSTASCSTPGASRACRSTSSRDGSRRRARSARPTRRGTASSATSWGRSSTPRDAEPRGDHPGDRPRDSSTRPRSRTCRDLDGDRDAAPGPVALGLIGLPQEQHERFNQLMDDRLEMILTRGSRAESSRGRLARLASVRERDVGDRRAGDRGAPRPPRERRDQPDPREAGRGRQGGALRRRLPQHAARAGHGRVRDDPAPDRDARQPPRRSPRACGTGSAPIGRSIPKAIEEMLRCRSPVAGARPPRHRGRRPPRRHDPRELLGHGRVRLGQPRRARVRRPGQLDVDRELRRHVAFSAGIHYCPGAPVSRAETRLLLEELLDRYRAVERAGPSLPDAEPDARQAREDPRLARGARPLRRDERAPHPAAARRRPSDALPRRTRRSRTAGSVPPSSPIGSRARSSRTSPAATSKPATGCRRRPSWPSASASAASRSARRCASSRRSASSASSPGTRAATRSARSTPRTSPARSGSSSAWPVRPTAT